MQKNITRILFLSLFLAGCSGRYVKPLWKGDFEKSRERAERKLDKDPYHAEANFSMLWFYYLNDVGKLSYLDSAYEYLMITLESIQQNPRQENARIGLTEIALNKLLREISLNAYLIVDEKNQLEYWSHYIGHYNQSHLLDDAIARRNQLAYRDARNRFSLESFQNFLENFPEAEQTKEARAIYQSLLFQTYLEKGTSEAMQRFIERYPENTYIQQAKRRYDRLVFEELTAEGELEQFVFFVKNHPDNPYVRQAEDHIYAFFANKNTSAAYHEFILQFPDNRNINEAWLNLFELETYSFETAKIEQFKAKFPGFPFPELAERRLEKSKRIPVPHWDEDAERYGYLLPDTESYLIEPVFGDALPFSEGLAAVSLDACDDEDEPCLYAFINLDGEAITEFIYTEAGSFEDGIALIGKGACMDDTDCRFGYLNRFGEEITPVIFVDALPFSEGLGLVQTINDLFGFIDMKGQTAIPFKFENASSFSSGLAAVMQNGRWGYVDRKGNWIIDAVYSNAGDFSEGLAAVEFEGRWGYVNELNEWVIEPQFAYAGKFDNGKAKVGRMQKGSSPQYPVIIKESTINREGNFVGE